MCGSQERVSVSFRNGAATRRNRCPQSQEYAMEKLTEMSRRSLLSDVAMVAKIENLFKKLITEIEEEHAKTGRINFQKIKAFCPFTLEQRKDSS